MFIPKIPILTDTVFVQLGWNQHVEMVETYTAGSTIVWSAL